MLMVVFGAGASYDSSPNNPSCTVQLDVGVRPPLANDLFETTVYKSNILNDYPGVASLFDDFSKTGRGTDSLERTLQKFRDGADEDPIRYCQLAAVKFYLRDLIKSIAEKWAKDHAENATTHSRLLKQMHACRPPGEPILIVTFNYDILIDLAIGGWPKHQIDNIDDYVKHDRFKLIKMHGSTNWGRKVDLSSTRIRDSLPRRNAKHISNYLINNADTLDLHNEYRIIDDDLSFGKSVYMPALSIPLAKKQDTKDCEYPHEHWVAMNKLLPNVSRILTIGWSAGDTYFLDKILAPNLLSRVQAHVVGADVNDAKEIKEKITNHLSIPVSYGEHGFTRFVAEKDGVNFMSGN